MTREQRLEAEAWYQALRAWRTRELHDSPPSVRVRPGGLPPRQVRGCPVCRSLRGPEYDLAILDARTAGRDVRSIVKRIARELGVPEKLVAWHASEHLSTEAPPPLIGEWARRPRIRLGRHVLTPIGWVPEEKLLKAIRETPEEYRALLDQVRFGKGPGTLLDKNGRFRGDNRAAYGRAALWLAQRVLRASLALPFESIR